MLSDIQLDEVKAKLELGRMLPEIVKEDYPSEKMKLVIDALINKFGRGVIQRAAMLNNLQSLTVEELNQRIANQEAKLDLIKAIRDSKL